MLCVAILVGKRLTPHLPAFCESFHSEDQANVDKQNGLSCLLKFCFSCGSIFSSFCGGMKSQRKILPISRHVKERERERETETDRAAQRQVA